MFKALLPEPHGDVERTGTMVAKNDQGGIRIELGVGARGNIAHGHE